MDTSLVQFFYHVMLLGWVQNLDIVMIEWLCHHFCSMSKFFWAFTAVMLSESSQVSKQSDAFANPFLLCSMSFWASLSTLIRLLRYSAASAFMLELLLWPYVSRVSPSNLAMLCIPSVMIQAITLESIPWCYLVVGILFLGSWTRDSPYLPHVDSVCSFL